MFAKLKTCISLRSLSLSHSLFLKYFHSAWIKKIPLVVNPKLCLKTPDSIQQESDISPLCVIIRHKHYKTIRLLMLLVLSSWGLSSLAFPMIVSFFAYKSYFFIGPTIILFYCFIAKPPEFNFLSNLTDCYGCGWHVAT